LLVVGKIVCIQRLSYFFECFVYRKKKYRCWIYTILKNYEIFTLNWELRLIQIFAKIL